MARSDNPIVSFRRPTAYGFRKDQKTSWILNAGLASLAGTVEFVLGKAEQAS